MKTPPFTLQPERYRLAESPTVREEVAWGNITEHLRDLSENARKADAEAAPHDGSDGTDGSDPLDDF